MHTTPSSLSAACQGRCRCHESPPCRSVLRASGALKTREWKTRDEVTGVENPGVDNAAQDDKGGQGGSVKG